MDKSSKKSEKKEVAKSTEVTDPNLFMKILLSTALDKKHLVDYNFEITEINSIDGLMPDKETIKDAVEKTYHIVGTFGEETIDFEHKYIVTCK